MFRGIGCWALDCNVETRKHVKESPYHLHGKLKKEWFNHDYTKCCSCVGHGVPWSPT